MHTASSSRPSSASARIRDICSRFEAEWQRSAYPRIDDFLPADGPAGDAGFDVEALVPLVMYDLEYRWKLASGKPGDGSTGRPGDPLPARPRLADYLGRYPALAQAGGPSADLICHEYYVRCRWGSRPGHDEYLAAHGRQHPDLRERLAEEDRQLPTFADEDTGPLVIGQTFGKYCVRAVLGRGAMGWVYCAYDPQLDLEVALKVPRIDPRTDEETRTRFLNEARAAAKIRHPNVCRVFDAGQTAEIYWIAMDLIRGRSLKDCIPDPSLSPGAGPAPLATPEAVRIVAKLARAVGAVHDHGIIHRDIKPANVIIGEKTGEPLLTDFGLASLPRHEELPSILWRQTQEGDTDASADFTTPLPHRTRPGTIVGTPAYMSPEQIRGQVGTRTDVYSLGVVLYQLLTGVLPFRGTREEVLDAILSVPPPAPRQLVPQLDRRLEAICLKAMAQAPEKRYASARELAEALERYADKRRKTGWPAWVLGLAAVLLAAVIVYVKTGNGTVTVYVDEPQAQITVDGTPYAIETRKRRLELPVGRHELKIEKEGFQTHGESVVIRWRGSAVELRVQLPSREFVQIASGRYLSGVASERIRGLAVDAQTGDRIITGMTDSNDLPKRQNERHGNNDIFLARIGLKGEIRWTCYWGGRGYEDATAVAVDKAGNIVIVGWTQSAGFEPAEAGAPTAAAGTEAIVVLFDPGGHELWRRYLGGKGEDQATAITFDKEGNVLVGGWTTSADFGGTDPAARPGGECHGFVAKLRAQEQGRIEWVRLFGGSGSDRITAIGVAEKSIFVAGDTTSDDLPQRADSIYTLERDAFLAQLDASGKPQWSRYLGGQNSDAATALAVDAKGQVWVGGWTSSRVLGTIAKLRELHVPGEHDRDVFLVHWDGKQWDRGVVFGGSDEDQMLALALDAADNVLVSGGTHSPNFVTTGILNRRLRGSCDGFLAKFSPRLELLYAGLIGGRDADTIAGLVATQDGAVLAGWTDSQYLPGATADGSAFGGGTDGFLVQVGAGQRRVKVGPPKPLRLDPLCVVWQQEFLSDRGTSIQHIQLTRDGKQLVVFHYGETPVARVTWQEVGRLSATEKSCNLEHHRVSPSGWVDSDGNVLLMSSFGYPSPRDGGFHIWKRDSHLAPLWPYHGGDGFEYVLNALTDANGDIYAAGYSGSFPDQGSACVKLNGATGKPFPGWPVIVRKGNTVTSDTVPPEPTGGGDCYAWALALDAQRRRLYRVGNDDWDLRDDKSRLDNCGRLVVHDADKGSVIFTRTLAEMLHTPTRRADGVAGGSRIGGVLIDPEGCIWLACTLDLYAAHNTPSGRERTVLLKLDPDGHLLQHYAFPGTGSYVCKNALRKGIDGAFYLSYELRHDGAVYPAVAKLTFDGRLLGKGVILKRGWDITGCGLDAAAGKIYVALSDATSDPGWGTRVLAVAEPASGPARGTPLPMAAGRHLPQRSPALNK